MSGVEKKGQNVNRKMLQKSEKTKQVKKNAIKGILGCFAGRNEQAGNPLLRIKKYDSRSYKKFIKCLTYGAESDKILLSYKYDSNILRRFNDGEEKIGKGQAL